MGQRNTTEPTPEDDATDLYESIVEDPRRHLRPCLSFTCVE